MNWETIINKEFEKPYFKQLQAYLDDAYINDTIYPKREHLYEAFRLCPLESVKVVIIGQDPYHGKNQAHGLCFSVLEGNKTPPSLRNMFKELQSDLGITRTQTNLSGWAAQGILLLNKILTVKEASPSSHENIGWEQFTNEIIKTINQKDEPVVFVLWGAYARSLKPLITNDQHTIIENVHPSPLSAYRGFFDSKPFSTINNVLVESGLQAIDWSL